MKEPWSDDPTWKAYVQAAEKEGGLSTEKGRDIMAEAANYLAKNYFQQATMDLGMLPAAPSAAVQQGALL